MLASRSTIALHPRLSKTVVAPSHSTISVSQHVGSVKEGSIISVNQSKKQENNNANRQHT